MSKPTHTPGPWTLQIDEVEITGPNRAPRRFWTIDKRTYSVESPAAYVPRYLLGGYIDNTEEEANARLIAAAPEMLEALKELHEKYCGKVFTFDTGRYCCNAGAAIAKATEGK